MAKFGKTVCGHDGQRNKSFVVKDANQCKAVEFRCAPGNNLLMTASLDNWGCCGETK
ncbi:MAG: hypothetical protein KAI47_01520 [Deltaproteobacteria bacterium]|nr:hypothetical protein [Deltaproteobacteria bacterium]